MQNSVMNVEWHINIAQYLNTGFDLNQLYRVIETEYQTNRVWFLSQKKLGGYRVE